MRTEFLTSSPGQTKKLGEVLAEEILKTRPGEKALVFGLVGDLGGGKTTFTQGMARGFRIREKVLSPTFVLMRKFKIRNPKSETNSKFEISKFKNFYHIDCYRIQKPKELLDLGFKEIVVNPQNIVAIEWADRIKKIIPEEAIWINFEFIDGKTRKIMVR